MNERYSREAYEKKSDELQKSYEETGTFASEKLDEARELYGQAQEEALAQNKAGDEELAEVLRSVQVKAETDWRNHDHAEALVEDKERDREKAAGLLKSMQERAEIQKVPAANPPHEKEMNDERTAFAREFQYRAEARNKGRKWWEKMFGLNKVSSEVIAQEDAQETYTKISNLKRAPKIYGRGYETAVNQGVSESELSQAMAKEDVAYDDRHNEGRQKYVANVKEHIPSTSPELRDARKEVFRNAQEWEVEQRKQKAQYSKK